MNTTSKGFKKPLKTEAYDVTVQNDNMDLANELITNMENNIAAKVDKVAGKGLSSNDYTTAEREKLAGIAAGAQVNTVTSVAGRTGAVTLTKIDVGLGNVDNVKQASKTEFDTHLADITNRGLSAIAKNISSTDLNNLVDNGFYSGNNLSNAPDAEFYYVEVMKHGSDVYVRQRITGVTGTNIGKTFERVKANTWQAWRQVFYVDGVTGLTGALIINKNIGYTATIDMDATGLKIGHNSAARDIEFQIASTTKMTIGTNGAVSVVPNNLYTTKQVRNVAIKTGADFTTAELATGDIGFIYE